VIGYVEAKGVAGLTSVRTAGMSKGMTIAGMVVSVLIFILFALDLVLKFPFRQASLAMDIAFVICALGLGFLSWSTWREFD
jgi:hypothetical protein